VLRRPTLIDISHPVVCGGRSFDEIVMVVGDPTRAARRFEEILGIGRWLIEEERVRSTTELLHGKPLAHVDHVSASIG